MLNCQSSQTGKKEDLQNRLMEWALEEESKKNKLEQTGIVDYRVLPLQTQKRRRNPGKERLDRLSNLLTSLNNNSSSLLFKATTKDDDDEDDEISLSVTNSTDEYLALLTKTYNTSPHTPYSNLQLTQLYNRAKVADINGDIDAAKCILTQLAEITPHDGRIVRRLARLHSSTGDITSAREILQKACSSYPENAYLWQGLANLELSLKRTGLARKYFKEAISADPDLPNSYHALGRLEHQEGNIRESMSILKKGIKHCPQNHRLYHALGNLYLEANMMKPAEEAFKKGMIYSPNWGQSFFYTSLAHVAYEMDGAIKAMDWLKKGIDLNPMHAQGWTALGELHESEGNFEEAREVYKEASNYYEKVRLKEKKMMRLGDKWRNVYINWAKMEEKAGRVSQAGEIYLKAAKVFPKDWNILTTFAIAMAKDRKRLSHTDIKSIFERACNIAGSRCVFIFTSRNACIRNYDSHTLGEFLFFFRHANPYRQYAKYEISLSNHLRARSIFYLGAEAVAKSPDERECRDRGLDALFYDWGLLEFKYMENPDGARLLFDKALELASLDNKELRAKIYCSIGEIELRNKNYYVTKHFACLSINESENNGTKEAWSLWANVADLLEQEEMADYCREQAKIQAMKEMKFWIDDDLTAAKLMKGFNLKNMLCKTPWNKKLMYQAMEDVSYTGKLK